MVKYCRVTPKDKKWIVQRVSDRKQFGKPFRLKSEAETYKLKLDDINNRSRLTDPMNKLSIKDIDILLSDIKSFYKKLYKLKKTIKN